jgi:hypothetical protein
LHSEVLTRVWTGFLVGHDRLCGREEAEPVARSVLTGHLDARHRALSLLMHAPGVPIAGALSINQLRCTTERWTDLLLGELCVPCDLNHLACDVQRAREFAADRQAEAEIHRGQRWSLLLASLRQAFPVEGPRSPNGDLNERIAGSVLSCFPSDAFDSIGLFHSLWMLRLRYAAEDAQGMLDQLCSHDRCSAESAK